MTKDEIIAELQSIEPLLRGRGVARLFLYGSSARNEAQATSDIDIFVDPVNVETFGFDRFMETYEALQKTLPGQHIGYSTREGIGKHFRPTIEKEAIRVF